MFFHVILYLFIYFCDKDITLEVENENIPTYDCIIIGAGMAGITALNNLFSNGHTNILLLEADNRIGGRIYSEKLYNKENKVYTTVELGANWIHGYSKNPLNEFIRKYNIKGKIESESDISAFLFEENNMKVNISESVMTVSDELRRILSDDIPVFYENLQSFWNIFKDLSLKSILSFFDYYQKFILTQNLSTIIKALAEYSTIDLNAAIDASSIGAIYDDIGTDIDPISTDDQFLVNDNEGFIKIIQEQLNELNQTKQELDKIIHLNSKVITILKNGQYVYVHSIENNKKRVFKCKTVLITVNVLSLASQTNPLMNFYPPFDQERLDAFHRFQSVVYFKLFISFSCVFWNEYLQSSSFFHVHNSDVGFFTFWQVIKGSTSPQHQCSNSQNTDNQFILLTTLVGKWSKWAENQSNHTIIHSAIQRLQLVFGNHHVPPYDNYIFTHWGKNSFHFGTFPTDALGQNLKFLQKLTLPHCDSIFFAGDGYTVEYVGFLHGAYLSALENVGRIINFLKKNF